MSNSQFVYGEFTRPGDASRAVTSLINASFEADEIDVLAVRPDGINRVPIVHHRPVATGVLVGLLAGLFLGVVMGVTLGQSITGDLGLAVLRWTLAGGAAGMLIGAVAGVVWWRSGADIRGRSAQARRFIVGTTVPEGRKDRVTAVLNGNHPVSVGAYTVNAGEAAQQHAEREVVARL